MRVYVQFTKTFAHRWDDKQKKIIPCEKYQIDYLGSDGVFILDGRNKLQTWIEDAKRRQQLINVHSDIITGFKIMIGDRFDNSKCVHEEIFGEIKQ